MTELASMTEDGGGAPLAGGIPAPRRNRFRRVAIERALAKPGLAVVALIGSRSHSVGSVATALEAAARQANVFQ